MLMSTRKLVQMLAVGASTAAIVAATAGVASAGEITGNGKYINNDMPHSNSICSYSGQNDGFHDPSKAENAADAAMRVQSYGQIVKAGGKAFAPSPGVACNGHTGGGE
jgi:hypothetical protein